jgi:hypothetical protein
MKIYVSEQGKPHFHGGNIFPRVQSVFCLTPRPEYSNVPFCETKKSRKYYLSAVFFPVFQAGKIFPPGAQENAETFRHAERNQKNTFTPYKCANII